MAARGALPLEPIELATVLFALSHDPDAEVKSRALESLAGLPEQVAFVVLEGPTHPAVLSHLARAHCEREPYWKRIALNAAADDSTIAYLATLPLRRVVDIISNNQERLLRSEDIVEALGGNTLTGRAVIERILTFLGIDAEEGGKDDMSSDVSAEAAEAAVRSLLGEELGDLARELVSDEEIEDESRAGNLLAAIQKMSVMQKIKLARLGGKEARTLLIRDRNKIVSTSVIGSPKITDSEIVTIAKSRNVSDEILRMISTNRDWTKNYQVKSALATNPKCPQPVALKFLNYLQDRDLRSIMKSKDVPSAISAHARRLLGRKGMV